MHPSGSALLKRLKNTGLGPTLKLICPAILILSAADAAAEAALSRPIKSEQTFDKLHTLHKYHKLHSCKNCMNQNT